MIEEIIKLKKDNIIRVPVNEDERTHNAQIKAHNLAIDDVVNLFSIQNVMWRCTYDLSIGTIDRKMFSNGKTYEQTKDDGFVLIDDNGTKRNCKNLKKHFISI